MNTYSVNDNESVTCDKSKFLLMLTQMFAGRAKIKDKLQKRWGLHKLVSADFLNKLQSRWYEQQLRRSDLRRIKMTLTKI